VDQKLAQCADASHGLWEKENTENRSDIQRQTIWLCLIFNMSWRVGQVRLAETQLLASRLGYKMFVHHVTSQFAESYKPNNSNEHCNTLFIFFTYNSRWCFILSYSIFKISMFHNLQKDCQAYTNMGSKAQTLHSKQMSLNPWYLRYTVKKLE
jgi:hypothetical protein